MGDKYRFSDGAWEYLTAGQDNWEPVRFPDILTDFGPYTAVADSQRPPQHRTGESVSATTTYGKVSRPELDAVEDERRPRGTAPTASAVSTSAARRAVRPATHRPGPLGSARPKPPADDQEER